jgi:hypothetical protein
VLHITPRVCAPLFCISLLPLFVSTSHSQTPMQNIKNRDDALENYARKEGRRGTRPDPNTALRLKSLKDDFRQLQIVNNELIARTDKRSREPMNFDEIRSSLGEIHKLAQRLLINLKLPDVKKEKDEISDRESPKISLPSGLLILDQKVMEFVQNPIFQQPLVLDAKLSVIAAQDLKDILRLTDMLRKETNPDP